MQKHIPPLSSSLPLSDYLGEKEFLPITRTLCCFRNTGERGGSAVGNGMKAQAVYGNFEKRVEGREN